MYKKASRFQQRISFQTAPTEQASNENMNYVGFTLNSGQQTQAQSASQSGLTLMGIRLSEALGLRIDEFDNET